MTPRLTFVVPAHNAADTLPDTLRSLMAQTEHAWEAVVVDDGSEDGTAGAACSVRDGRVRVVRQPNMGLAGARNRGFEAARGEAVCFLDADDAVEPDFARTMLGALEGHDAAACACAMVGPGLEDLGWIVEPGDQDRALARMVEFNPFPVGAVVLRTDAPRRLGHAGALFDTARRVHEDWALWLALTAAGLRWAPIVRRPLFRYRLRAGSMSCALERMWREGLVVIEGAGAPEEARARAGRRWTIRNLARAGARGDAALARAMRAEAGALEADDLGVLAGALRWALGQEFAAGPAQIAGLRARWEPRVRAALAGAVDVDSLLARVGGDGGLVESAAGWIAGALRAGEVAVLCGMGRNGRALLDALRARGAGDRVAWLDDDPAARVEGAPRLAIDALRAHHLAIVTPDEGAAIAARLRAAGVDRVVSLAEAAARGATLMRSAG